MASTQNSRNSAGRMFKGEYDLALAIMDGMEARSVKGGCHTLERFKFNSA